MRRVKTKAGCQYATARFEIVVVDHFETGPLPKSFFVWIRDSHKRTFDNAPPELGILAC